MLCEIIIKVIDVAYTFKKCIGGVVYRLHTKPSQAKPKTFRLFHLP